MTFAKTAITVSAHLGLVAVGLILIFGSASLLDMQGPFGIKPASASSQWGILGQPAPELELNSWIDGNGKPMAPVKLQDYRDKVIYLYFFQDW